MNQNTKSSDHSRLLWISLEKEDSLINSFFYSDVVLFHSLITVFVQLLFLCKLDRLRWLTSEKVVYPALVCPLLTHWACWQNDLKISLAVSSGSRTRSTHQCLALNIKCVFSEHKVSFEFCCAAAQGTVCFWLLENSWLALWQALTFR